MNVKIYKCLKLKLNCSFQKSGSSLLPLYLTHIVQGEQESRGVGQSKEVELEVKVDCIRFMSRNKIL